MPLNPRQRDVIRLRDQGDSVAQVAVKFGLTVRQVELAEKNGRRILAQGGGIKPIPPDTQKPQKPVKNDDRLPKSDHEHLLTGCADRAEGKEPSAEAMKWARHYTSLVPDKTGLNIIEKVFLMGASLNKFLLSVGVLPNGLQKVGALIEFFRLESMHGFDADESGPSSGYGGWACLGMATTLLDLDDPELRAKVEARLRLTTWMLSATMDDKGIPWHAGQRCYLSIDDGCWTKEAAQFLVLGKKPRKQKEPKKWQRGYHEKRGWRALERPDASRIIASQAEPNQPFGYGFSRLESVAAFDEDVEWIAREFLQAAKGQHWRSPHWHYRYSDGTVASRFEKSHGSNTAPCLGLVKRPGQKVEFLWPWRWANGSRVRSVREGRIRVEQMNGPGGIDLLNGEPLRPRSVRVNLGNSEDMLVYPIEHPLLAIRYGEGARVWLRGEEVRYRKAPKTAVCRHVGRLGSFMAAYDDAQERMKRGEGQRRCPECNLWIWEREFIDEGEEVTL